MKVAILAGGFGSRLSDETTSKPKPMIEIGNKPILWHIMSIYAAQGFSEFIIALGYRGWMIKEYFLNYHHHNQDMTISLKDNIVNIHKSNIEDWTITLLDTGEKTDTGGRVKQIADFTGEDFMLTYGDGLANVDINELLKSHYSHKKIVTVTAVHSPERFGRINIDENGVNFIEKPNNTNDLINGGFFVISPNVLDFIQDNTTSWEFDSMRELATSRQLSVYFHRGFWHCMDTPRDVRELNEIFENKGAVWMK